MDERTFDTSLRNKAGAKKRIDSQGDAWANQHRDALPKDFYFQDVDAMFGSVAFGYNTGDKLFLEYVPDGYENRTEKIRDFSVIAIFDRKTTEHAIKSNRNVLSCAFHLWLCRALADVQSIAPRFFYVVGDQSPPWIMIEMDVQSSDEIGERVVLEKADWSKVWHSIGLSGMREEAKKILNKRL